MTEEVTLPTQLRTEFLVSLIFLGWFPAQGHAAKQMRVLAKPGVQFQTQGSAACGVSNKTWFQVLAPNARGRCGGAP